MKRAFEFIKKGGELLGYKCQQPIDISIDPENYAKHLINCYKDNVS